MGGFDQGPVGLIAGALFAAKEEFLSGGLHVCMEFTSVPVVARLLNRLTI